MCWISIYKDVLHELYWMCELQSRSSADMRGISQSEGKQIERKMEKMLMMELLAAIGIN